jgi:hypothetical protein
LGKKFTLVDLSSYQQFWSFDMTPSPNYFTAHLRNVDESYGQHFLHASYYFVMLLAAAICALIHAILPFLFEKTASQIISKLYRKMSARKLFDGQSRAHS